MFATYQLNDLSIDTLADLSNKKKTELSQSDLLNLSLQLPSKSNYMRSLSRWSPPAAKAAQLSDYKSLLLKSGSEAVAAASESFQISINEVDPKSRPRSGQN